MAREQDPGCRNSERVGGLQLATPDGQPCGILKGPLPARIAGYWPQRRWRCEIEPWFGGWLVYVGTGLWVGGRVVGYI